MQPIDLHLVSWNRPDMTELVIRTIHKNTKPKNFRLVVFDNGSNLETRDRLNYLNDNGMIDEIIWQSKNVGLEMARDWLLSTARGQFFVCVDNDCLPEPMVNGQDWIERLVDLMDKYEDFAAISCRTQVMIGTGNIFEEADLVGDEIVEFPHPGGSFRIMRTDAVRQVGGWDRQADGRGAEERYIGSKLHDAGYRTAFATKITCLHLFGTRGKKATDRWGYEKSMKPEETGHSDISHPALTNGDDEEEVKKYAGVDNARRYFS